MDIIQRKEAEEALKESEERYRAVMEQSVEAIYLYDAETKRVLESNEAFRRMMGYTEEELLGSQIYDFIDHHQEDIDRNVRRSLREKRRHIGERRYRCKDGTVILVDTSASVISYDGKKALCAVSRDVTERKRLEEALRKSEESLVEAQRLVHLGSWEWNPRTGEVTWSDEAYRIYGYEPKEFVPSLDKLMELVHPDDRELIGKRIDAALYEGEPYDFEHRIIRPDGTERVVHRRAEVVRDEEGEPLRMVGTVQDITERTEAEERIKASEAEMRALFAAMNDVILVLDSEGRYRKAVPTNPSLLIRPPDDLVGKTLHEVFSQEQADEFLDSVQRALEGQQTLNIEYSLRIGERDVCFAASVSPMLEDQVIIVARDITERKRAEEETREVNRRLEELAVLKADFTAMVAHELDTPLAVIRGYADMLATGELETADRDRALAKIQSETDVMAALIADARHAAAIERADFAVKAREVPIAALMKDAVAYAETLCGNHHLAIENVADGQVWADPYRIGQVLRNLLSNAAKYSPEAAPIELRTVPGDTPGHIRIEVADHGVGVHPDDVNRIFEKFGRGRDSVGRKVAGVGLGLYLSRRILQAHGSDLTLDPAPGGGSVFGFELEAAR